eukprot:3323464-Lingulodinium_polyedra.AAC.1
MASTGRTTPRHGRRCCSCRRGVTPRAGGAARLHGVRLGPRALRQHRSAPLGNGAAQSGRPHLGLPAVLADAATLCAK